MMKPAPQLPDPSLDAQHAAFLDNKFLAMPIAGAVAWAAIGVVGALAPLSVAVWAVWIGTGMIFYLGLGVARMTGEDLLGRERRSDFFDRVFLLAVASALLVYAIAIPFFLVEPTSLPLSVGVLTGIMWLPLSGLLRHWIGLFHGVVRTKPRDGLAERLIAIRDEDPAARVVMCSAMGQQSMVIESIQAGAKDFIVKPFQPDRVLAAIEKALA